MKRRGIYNRILVPAAALLLTVMSIFGIREMMVSSVALEQEVRCGIEAHAHSGECYEGHRRVCGKEEHHHSRNCYLVLLEENDINRLLVQMSARTDNSLEGVISQTVDNALVYNVNLTSPLAEGTTLEDVAALNRTVEENNVQPAVVFNENIQSSSASNDTLGAVLPSISDGGVSTLALGESTTTEKQWANYYVYLDNDWITVGKMRFDVDTYENIWGSTRYRAQESMAEILDLYNGALGTNLTANDVNFRSSTNGNNFNRASTATKSGDVVILANGFSNESSAAEVRYVRLVNSNNQALQFYTVTLQNADGSETVMRVKSGTSITLPAGYTWERNGVEYEGGTSVSITAKSTFRGYVMDTRLQIHYDVNFPTINEVTVSTTPTLAGLAQTTKNDIVEDGADSLIRNVSQQEVKAPLRNNGTGQHRMIRFMGWRVGDSDVILSPNATLTWSELASYVGSDKILELNGVWEYHAKQTVSFFVRYDSVAVDTEGNIGGQDSTKYTNEIFSAFVMGVDTSKDSVTLTADHGVADETADNSFTADQNIRALYGQKAEGVWLTSFPEDDYIFEQLKLDTTGNLRVDGDVVRTEDLNSNVYTIRWFVFKCQDDAWHVDGRLVKKEGLLDVTKSFAGNQEAIARAKDDFYIRLSHQERTEVHYLYLTTPTTLPADGDVILPDATRSSGDFYTWRISGMTYGEPWIAEENTGQPTNVIVHSDYRIVDTYGPQSRSGTGTSVEFLSSTVATDMDVWYPLTINFTNIYHNTDSIIIKKEDALTGSPVGGAVFQLLQKETVLNFTYDSASKIYRYDPVNGSITELSGSSSGYYELNIQGFSYADGNIVVKEIQAPQGYTPIENIVIGYRQTTVTAAVVSEEEVISHDTDPPEKTVESEDSVVTEDTSVPDDTALSDDTGQADVADQQDDVPADGEEAAEEEGGEDTDEGTDSGTEDVADEDEGVSASVEEIAEEPTEESAEESVEETVEEQEEEPVLLLAAEEATTDLEAQAETPVVELLSSSPMASYNNGLLIVRNSTESTSVTVNKQWRCPAADWREVTVQLMANDAPVTSLISGVPLTKTLNEGNGWSATWTDLPLYANGEPIVWSVKEVKIGNESCLSNYTFVNWLVDYSPVTYTYEEGKLTNTAFTITNDTYRTMLRLIKTNLGGGIRLEGAVFMLEHLIDGEVDSDFVVRTATTNADGMIGFDNLKYGDYRLTELQPPGGYEEMTTPIYLTILSNGTVAVQEHAYAMAGNTAYTIQVLNEQLRPLPSTGGTGTGGFVAGGLLLMMAAATTTLFRKRKEDLPT